MKNTMNSSNQMLSKASAARILNVKEVDISKVELWGNCAFIHMAHSKAKMVSLKKFKENFAESRKGRSADLEVIPVPLCGSFVVKNPKRKTQYLVYLMGDSRGDAYRRIECGCEDFARQIRDNPEMFGTEHACCKHIYAVLGHIGYSNLKDFIKR